MNQFWIVWTPVAGANITLTYATEAEANTAANRLAEQKLGQEVYVCKALRQIRSQVQFVNTELVLAIV